MSAATEHSLAISGDGRRIEQGQRVVQLPFFGPCASATARHVEHGVEQLPADLLDRRAAGHTLPSTHANYLGEPGNPRMDLSHPAGLPPLRQSQLPRGSYSHCAVQRSRLACCATGHREYDAGRVEPHPRGERSALRHVPHWAL
jgi:hypothetical protein